LGLETVSPCAIAAWRILLTLQNHPGSTAVEINDRWAMEKMAVSRSIRLLEERYARGEIGRDEFLERRAVLRQGPSGEPRRPDA